MTTIMPRVRKEGSRFYVEREGWEMTYLHDDGAFRQAFHNFENLDYVYGALFISEEVDAATMKEVMDAAKMEHGG